MEIIKTNCDLNDKRMLYKLTKSSGVMVQDADDGISVPVSAYCLYKEVKDARDGSAKESTVLSFVAAGGLKYSTISATFIREFTDIVDIMAGDAFAIIIKHGKTKGGKPFVTCELDCDFKA